MREAQAALSIIPFEQSRRLFPSAITSPSIYSLPPVPGVPHLFSSSIVPSLSIRSRSSPFTLPCRALAPLAAHRFFFFFSDSSLLFPADAACLLLVQESLILPRGPRDTLARLPIYLIGPLHDSLGETPVCPVASPPRPVRPAIVNPFRWVTTYVSISC